MKWSILDQSVVLKVSPDGRKLNGHTSIRIRLEEPGEQEIFFNTGSLKITERSLKEIELTKKKNWKKRKTLKFAKHVEYFWHQMSEKDLQGSFKEIFKECGRNLDSFEKARREISQSLDSGTEFLTIRVNPDSKHAPKEQQYYKKKGIHLFFTIVFKFEVTSFGNGLLRLPIKIPSTPNGFVITKKGWVDSGRSLFPCVDQFYYTYYFSKIRLILPKGYTGLTSGVLVRTLETRLNPNGQSEVYTPRETETDKQLPKNRNPEVLIMNRKIPKNRVHNMNLPASDDPVDQALRKINVDSGDERELFQESGIRLGKRGVEEFENREESVGSGLFTIFDYEIEREMSPNDIGFVVGPFQKLESQKFVDEVYYLEGAFESQRNLVKILEQFARYEKRIFGQWSFSKKPIFVKKTVPDPKNKDGPPVEIEEERENQEKLKMVLLPGVFWMDVSDLRKVQESPKVEPFFWSNMFVLTEELMQMPNHLELYQMGLGNALKYKFLAFFRRYIRLKSPNGKRPILLQ